MTHLSSEPPRILFLASLALGFLCALAWILWESIDRVTPATSGRRSDRSAPRSLEPMPRTTPGTFEVTEEDRRLYSPRALRRDPALEEVDPEAAFREIDLPWIEESQRFEQSALGLGLGRDPRRAPQSPQQARGKG